jgi:hypothetical protein
MTHEEFVKKVNKIFPEIEILGKYKNLSSRILVRDKYGDLNVLAGGLINKSKPTIRTALNKDDYFSNKAKEVHKNKYNYSKVKYKNSLSKICIICPEHGEFWQRPSGHLSGMGCSKCGDLTIKNKISYNKNKFVKKSNKVHNFKYDYSKSNYINNKTKICVICPEHGDFWVRPDHHMHGHECMKCYREGLKITKEEFIYKSKEIHDDKYIYSEIKYIDYDTKVKIICPFHGEFWQTPKNHASGAGCSKCNISYGEKRIEDWLNYKNIIYIVQKSFEDLKNVNKLYFDFYLPEYNICIEYDGQQHFEPIEFYGGIEAFKNRKIRDNIKNNYCKDNNIKLIRIPYYDFDNIESILQESVEN